MIIKSLNELGNTTNQMKVLGSKTKIKINLVSGGRLWIDDVPNGSIQSELLKHRVGISQMRNFERVEVPARQ